VGEGGAEGGGAAVQAARRGELRLVLVALLQDGKKISSQVRERAGLHAGAGAGADDRKSLSIPCGATVPPLAACLAQRTANLRLCICAAH